MNKLCFAEYTPSAIIASIPLMKHNDRMETVLTRSPLAPIHKSMTGRVWQELLWTGVDIRYECSHRYHFLKTEHLRKSDPVTRAHLLTTLCLWWLDHILNMSYKPGQKQNPIMAAFPFMHHSITHPPFGFVLIFVQLCFPNHVMQKW